MSRMCMVTGKGTARGNNVAHCNKKVRRSFKVNVHWKRFWVASQNKFVRLRVSSKGMKTIDKNGIESVLAELRLSGQAV